MQLIKLMYVRNKMLVGAAYGRRGIDVVMHEWPWADSADRCQRCARPGRGAGLRRGVG
jgi:hypothetical protein